jgi:hypothetical protein
VQNDYRDIIDQVPPGERRCQVGRARFTLSGLLYGRFCFPFGQAFHCRTTRTISTKAGDELFGSFGWNSMSIGAKTTLETTEAFAHTADQCQLCNPQTCHFDSHLWVWRCERGVSGFQFNTLYEKFVPGDSQPLFDPNCGLCPECKDRSGVFAMTQDTVPLATSSMESRVVRVLRMDRVDHDAEGEQGLDAAMEYVNSFAAPLGSDETIPDLLAIWQAGGRTVNLIAPRSRTTSKGTIQPESCWNHSSQSPATPPADVWCPARSCSSPSP